MEKQISSEKGGINFLENYKRGVLCGFPIEESAITAFEITQEELGKYCEKDPDYAHKKWPDILKSILDDRKSA